jgi:hypothetical protein
VLTLSNTDGERFQLQVSLNLLAKSTEEKGHHPVVSIHSKGGAANSALNNALDQDVFLSYSTNVKSKKFKDPAKHVPPARTRPQGNDRRLSKMGRRLP